jgi:hypothetical protein
MLFLLLFSTQHAFTFAFTNTHDFSCSMCIDTCPPKTVFVYISLTYINLSNAHDPQVAARADSAARVIELESEVQRLTDDVREAMERADAEKAEADDAR